MARNRRTYRNPDDAGTPPDVGGGAPAQPVQPPEKKSTWLRTILTIAGGAIVGAVGVDMYRKFTSGRGAGDVGDDAPAQPQINPTSFPQMMPMPIPMPMPMPMFGGGHGGHPPAPAAPMTGAEKIELAKLQAAKAEAEAQAAELRAWEDGDVD